LTIGGGSRSSSSSEVIRVKLFNDIDPLSRALDVRGARHQVLAGNLANIDTPGFTPQDVDFDGAMRSFDDARAAAGGDGDGGVDPASAPIETQDSDAFGAEGLDGNKVDLDKTMAALGENGMQYSATARTVEKKLAILRYVASDGNA
jgi:flagellar basal-body rod protein FlgB